MSTTPTTAEERSRAFIDATIRVLTRAAEAGVVVESQAIDAYYRGRTSVDIFPQHRPGRPGDVLAEAFDCEIMSADDQWWGEGGIDGIAVAVHGVTPQRGSRKRTDADRDREAERRMEAWIERGQHAAQGYGS